MRAENVCLDFFSYVSEPNEPEPESKLAPCMPHCNAIYSCFLEPYQSL